MPDSNSSTVRTVEELRTLYLLYPHLRDILVEGREDARLLRWYTKKQAQPSVRFYAVNDRVSIDGRIVEEYHPEVNNRGRVLTIAALAGEWNLEQPTLTCVIDSDFDVLSDDVLSSPCLLRTDYAALEIYGLQRRPLDKFLGQVSENPPSAVGLVEELLPAWHALFAVRYVMHQSQCGRSLVNGFAAKCVTSTGEVVADADELLRASLGALAPQYFSELAAQVRLAIEQLVNLGMRGVRGHDVAPLLIRKLRLQNDLAQTKTVELLLRACLSRKDLRGHDLFRALDARLSA